MPVSSAQRSGPVRAAVYRRMSEGKDTPDWEERQFEDGGRHDHRKIVAGALLRRRRRPAGHPVEDAERHQRMDAGRVKKQAPCPELLLQQRGRDRADDRAESEQKQ